MTIPVVNVTCDVFQITGQGLPNAQVFLDLTRLDKYTVGSGGVVPAGRTVIPCDASGHGVGQAFPNDLGTQGTQYRVTVVDQYGNVVFPAPGEPPACARLPASDCALHAVMFTGPQMSTDDATAQVLLSMKWAMLESGTVDGTYFSSAEYAHGSQAGTGGSSRNWAQYLGGDVPGASALSRSAMSWSQDDLRGATYGGSSRDWAIGSGLIDGVTYYSSRQYAINSGNSAAAALASQQQADRDAQQTSADRTQTGLDRTQTGLDRAAADGDVQTGRGYMLTAVAQASLATVMAASASSVAQQDLSGVMAAALHRSPNAVVAMCIDDVSKHSDGGACLQRLDNLSWMNETLQGAWLGWQGGGAQSAGESMARLTASTLGAELLSNGTFDSNISGWTMGTAGNSKWLSNGRLQLTALNGGSGNDTVYSGNIAVVGGQIYKFTAGLVLSFDATGKPSSYARCYPNSVSAGAITVIASNGLSSAGQITTNADASDPGVMYVMFAQSGNIRIQCDTANYGAFSPVNYTAQFDNLSFKQVTAVASQPSGSYYGDATDGKFKRLWSNLLKSSDNLSNATNWSPSSVSVTANAATAPDGTNTASLLTENGNSGHDIAQYVAMTAGITYTASAYAKDNGRRYFVLQTVNYNSFGAVFDLTAGTVASTQAGSTGTITSVGNGWYRVTLTFTANTTTNSTICLGMNNSAGNGTTASYVSTGSSLYVWRAQIVYGSFSAGDEVKSDTDGTVTEVFRGNVAKYGRTAWVAEASRVVGYAIDQPGRPMWMVFSNVTAGAFLNFASIYGAQAVSCVAALNGCLVIGTGGGGVVVDFSRDSVKIFDSTQYNTNPVFAKRYIALRNGTGAYAYAGSAGDSYVVAQRTINAVAMTTMPDAPVDPVTGLQVPTIAVGTGGGLSVIKHDGTVVSSTGANNYKAISINPYMLSAADWSTSWHVYALAPSKLSNSFALTVLNANSAPGVPGYFQNGAKIARRGLIGLAQAKSEMNFVLVNEMAQTGNLAVRITDTSNTGLLSGDVRRCMFAGVSAGVDSATSLLTNGAFNSDTSGWSPFSAATTISWAAGAMRLTIASGTAGDAYQVITTEVGKTYTVSGTLVGSTGAITLAKLMAGTTAGSGNLATSNSSTAPGAALSLIFTATGTTTYITAEFQGPTGSTADFDNIATNDLVADRSYKNKPATVFGTLTKTVVASAAQLVFWGGFSAANYAQEAYSADLDFASGFALPIWLTGITAAASTFYDRSAAGGGASVTWGTDATGKLTATVVDSVGGSRTVTTTAAYVGVPSLLAELSLSTSGTLTIKVNGEVAGQTTGAPLATLANATAVVTWGNNRALTAAFPGGIALARPTATVPSDDASRFIYQQEQAMFRAGAQVTLPDSGALVDLDYDPTEDKWKVASAANESTFVGLVRTASAPVSAGSFTKVAHRSGMKLVSRSGTNPGVDVTLPSLNAKEEFLKRAEAAAKLARLNEPFDWSGQFTATTTNGSTALTNVASLSYPSQASIIGAKVSGSGIPAGAYVTDVQGTTVYISAPATAGASGVSISIVSFPLPAGYEVKAVYTGGTGRRREGSGWDFTRAYDGFREQVVFSPSAPGNVNVQFDARRIAS